MSLHRVYLITGIIALAISLIAYAVKKKSQILGLRMITDTIWIVNYFCKGSFAFTGAVNAAVCLMRDSVFFFRTKEKRWASHIAWFVVFCLFYATTHAYTWAGYKSLIPGVSSIISTSALYSSNLRFTRWMTILAMAVNGVYLILVGNMFNLAANVCSIISAIIGLVRDARDRKKNAAPESA